MRLPLDLDGPAPVWPRPLDVALEWWATLSGRGRALLRVAAAAVVVLAATGGLVEGRWGPPVEVVVATRHVPAGAVVGADDLGVVTWPRDLVPAGAITTLAAVPEAAVTDGVLVAGMVVTSDAVRGGGPAAAAPLGTALVPIPGDLLPPLPVGTRVDLAVTAFDGSAAVVARSATVAADDGTWQWVRVDRGDVAAVAGGVGDGSLVAAVVRDGP